MKTETIKKTALLRLEDGDYIVESPLCEDVIGAGDTEEEAWQVFNEILADYEEAHKENRVAKGPGRPAKGKIKFAVEINPDIKDAISACAKDLGISQGELVECAYRFFQNGISHA